MGCRKDCLLWSLISFLLDDGQCLHSDLFAGGDQALDRESSSTGVLSSSMLVSKCLIKLDYRGKGTKKFTNQIFNNNNNSCRHGGVIQGVN